MRRLLAFLAMTIVVGAQAPEVDALALSFAECRSGLRITDHDLAGPAGAFSLRCRMRLMTETRGTADLVHQRTADGDRLPLRLSFGPGQRLRAAVQLDGGRILSLRSPKVTARQWHEVAITWRDGVLTLFLDDEEVGQESSKAEQTFVFLDAPLLIGPHFTRRQRRGKPFPGFLADLAIWRAAPDPGKLPDGLEQAPILELPLRSREPTHVITVQGGRAEPLPPSLSHAGWAHPAPQPVDDGPAAPQVRRFDFPAGHPSSAHAPGARDFVVLVHDPEEERVGLVHERAAGQLGLTWLTLGEAGPRTRELPNIAEGQLAAAAISPEGALHYLVVEKRPEHTNESRPLKVALMIVDEDGELVRQQALDSTPQGLNVFELDTRWRGDMQITRQRIAILFAHRMWRSGDGLRHQRGTAFTLDRKSLEFATRPRQSSGHSFGNLLHRDDRDEVMALDLGDNYPRGVHLHRFDKGGLTSRVIFTYKTLHGRRPFRGSPVYTEISESGTTFYQWSNDNGTYTELGGLIPHRRSYSVVFATDRSPDGRVLDNARALHGRNDPRDLVFLPITRRFRPSRGKPSVVTDDLIAGPTPQERVETGGYFTFDGDWREQRVTGHQWLTNYAPGERATTPHVFPAERDTLRVVWQKTAGGRPVGCYLLDLDSDGEVVKPATALKQGLHLLSNRRALTAEGRHWFLGAQGGRGLVVLSLPSG